MDPLHRRITRRIRTISEERGIYLTHLPDRAGVTRSHFFEVMKGNASPTIEWLGKVAKALDVDVEALVMRRRPARPA